MPKLVNLSGNVYGKLTVLRKLQSSRDGSILWECVCACGNIYQASTRHLNRKNNSVKSCGCDQFKAGEKHSQWQGHKKISGHWWSSHVKHSANCKGRKTVSLSLTKEEAYCLFLEQEERCWFTKEPLVISNDSKLNTASIDRIDNTKGYSVDNVRWVHKSINMMKRTYSDEYFVGWCKKVASKSGGLSD